MQLVSFGTCCRLHKHNPTSHSYAPLKCPFKVQLDSSLERCVGGKQEQRGLSMHSKQVKAQNDVQTRNTTPAQRCFFPSLQLTSMWNACEGHGVANLVSHTCHELYQMAMLDPCRQVWTPWARWSSEARSANALALPCQPRWPMTTPLFRPLQDSLPLSLLQPAAWVGEILCRL